MRETVVRVRVIKDPRFARVGAGELDGRFNGLGAGVAEEDAFDLSGAARDELLGQEPRQQRAVHLDHVGKVGVNRLVQGVFDDGVASAECEDAKAAQEVEVALAGLVVEVTAFVLARRTGPCRGF